MDALADRREGVVLLSDARSSQGMSQYRELVRFFELAFGKANVDLPDPLAQFLIGSRFGFTRETIRSWVPELRHRSTHADHPERGIAHARDVEPLTPTMLVAAYDVLLNKVKWNSPDDVRRLLWPSEGPSAPENTDPPGAVLDHTIKTGVRVLMLDRWMRFGLEPFDYLPLLKLDERSWTPTGTADPPGPDPD